MGYNRSNFPNQYDLFPELYDVSPSDSQDLDILFTLQKIINRTPTEEIQYQSLLTTYNNKIINAEKLNYFQDSVTATQKFFKDSVDSYINYSGVYNINAQYVIYNTVKSATGDIYLALKNNIGMPLTDSIAWTRISSKGDKGDKGDSIKGDAGIGLAFVGAYDPSATYMLNQAVEYNGSLYGCISAIPVTGISPSNIINWSMVVSKGSSTFLAVLRNSVTVNTNISSLPIGIVGFNMNTDQIFVYKNKEYIEQNQEYVLSSNGTNIEKTSDTWNGLTVPIYFNFVVFKNIVQGVTLSDGSLIQINSITLDKLNVGIQSQINKVGDSFLQTTAQNLSGGLNELKIVVDSSAIAVAKKIENKGNTPAIQSGLDASKPNPITNINEIYVATDSKKIYRSNGVAYDMIGGSSTVTDNFVSKTQLEIDASDLKFTGTKKVDLLCWDGQSVYKSTLTTGSIGLTSLTINNLRFGNYVLMIRFKSANNALATNAINASVLKNISGVFTSILNASRNIKANEFTNITDYQCFYINFKYSGIKATNNELKINIDLLIQTVAYEVSLDCIQIMPVGMGVFTF